MTHAHASPQDQERHALRTLLCHTRGPTSFEDLRTVDGGLCATFKEAAMRSGYLQDDREWAACMEKAAVFQRPYQLRQLFATIPQCSIPTDTLALWNKFYGDLSRDFEYTYRALINNDDMVKFKTLASLHDLLAAGGKSLSNYPDLPQLSEFPDLALESLATNTLIRRELEGYDRNELQDIVDNVDRLNANQQSIYDEIISAVESERPAQKLFFIGGPGGTGKSTLLNHVLAKMRLEGKIAIAVASSDIASLLLPGGRTAHSTFKIPLTLTKDSTCRLPKQSHIAALLAQASLIAWEEAPMIHRFAFEAVNRSLCDILENDEPFGGKVMALSGDFRQILPIVKRGAPSDTVHQNFGDISSKFV